MSFLTTEQIEEIFDRFKSVNPNPKSELKWKNPFTLLVAVVLSAQTTDKSVNKATEELFKIADTPEKMVALGVDGLIPYIKSIGLYRNKASHVIGLSKMLISDFGGKVPDSREELMKLPGVGRKTANVVLNVVFQKPTMPVDTHLLRICPKIGLAQGVTPEQVEQSLIEHIPEKYMQHAHHWLILHGRYVCTARNPKCAECIISDLCKSSSVYASTFIEPVEVNTVSFSSCDWYSILEKSSHTSETPFSIPDYYKILSSDYPDFLDDYISTPAMQRLGGVGLLCGTDWTPLYKNRFYYSRLDHSIGVALIVWNFTHNKEQTLAALFHDISTPIFSHAIDFKNGDALNQESTEKLTENCIKNSKEICALLERDGIPINKVSDYHIYPIADNDLPSLSADRLEYMFPSGAALHSNWTLSEIKNIYDDIRILKNEEKTDELGFCTLETALEYCKKFIETSHILQLNENKLALQMLGEIAKNAIALKIISEDDILNISEKEAIERFEKFCAENSASSGSSNENNSKCPDPTKFISLYKTFRTMTQIKHTQEPLENHFCVNLTVKQRYVDPLVKLPDGHGEHGGQCKRLSTLSKEAHTIISDFLSYKDTPYGCVEIIF